MLDVSVSIQKQLLKMIEFSATVKRKLKQNVMFHHRVEHLAWNESQIKKK